MVAVADVHQEVEWTAVRRGLLTETPPASGLDRALSSTLGSWKRLGRHDPGKKRD